MKKIILILLSFIGFSLFSQTRIKTSPVYPTGITAALTGSGTVNYLSKYSSANTLTPSIVYQDGNNIGIGLTSTSAKLHIVSSGSTVATFNSKFFNSVNRNLLNIYDSGVLFGAGNGSENEFIFGVSDGYMGSGGSFTMGSLDFSSNFNLILKGNSEIYLRSTHASGQFNRIGYFGGDTYKILSSTTTDISYISPTILRLGVNSSETNNENSSALQINSTTKGLLMPRMTTAQINAISSPANGLEVYNTDINTPCFYDGSAWRKVSHAAM